MNYEKIYRCFQKVKITLLIILGILLVMMILKEIR